MQFSKNESSTEPSSKSGRKAYAGLAVAVVALFMFSAIAPAAFATLPPYYPYTIYAGGSTFVNPVMQTWTTAFSLTTGGVVSISYAATGSGAATTGIESQSNSYMFGASDAPLTTAQAAPYVAHYGPLLQIPETLGGVAIFYNVPGVTKSLNLTGQIIGEIYLGDITMWNDPQIQAVNPGCLSGSCVLPALSITAVRRSDGSGTTYALTNFLEKTSADWNASWTDGRMSTSGCPCYAKTVPWYTSGSFTTVGESGSGGVAGYVNANAGSIGYADSYYALSNGLLSASVLNQHGQYLTPTLTTINTAAAADYSQVLANPTYTITNAPGAGSYPISTYTYIFVWANQNQSTFAQGYDIAQFLQWIVTQGQAFGPLLNYPKLPSGIVSVDLGLIEQMNYKGADFIKGTTTQVTCNPTAPTVTPSKVIGAPVDCKVTVKSTVKAPTGNVILTTSLAGSFSSYLCTLSPGASDTSTCSKSFTGSAVGTTTITAAYQGDMTGGPLTSPVVGPSHAPSSNVTSVTVTQKTSTLTMSCAPSTTTPGTTINCFPTVHGYYPAGTVTITQSVSGFLSLVSPSTSFTCTISPVGPSTTQSQCEFHLSASTSGHDTLTATYTSSNTDNSGSSGTHGITIT
jgi:phosphate transport system substrate-binding protein